MKSILTCAVLVGEQYPKVLIIESPFSCSIQNAKVNAIIDFYSLFFLSFANQQWKERKMEGRREGDGENDHTTR